jgi:proteasome lid subunit RPN8/RPN11
VRGAEVPSSLLLSMRRWAEESYPDESCGFLYAAASGSDDAVRRIVDAEPTANRSPAERRRRFVILPDELRAAEERAARRSAVVAGFFHSHPDHPARPSAFDQEHAWPWYLYLILSTGAGGRSAPVGAFELDADRREFREVPLIPAAAPIVVPRAG